jgi:hypothetical protein
MDSKANCRATSLFAEAEQQIWLRVEGKVQLAFTDKNTETNFPRRNEPQNYKPHTGYISIDCKPSIWPLGQHSTSGF